MYAFWVCKPVSYLLGIIDTTPQSLLSELPLKQFQLKTNHSEMFEKHWFYGLPDQNLGSITQFRLKMLAGAGKLAQQTTFLHGAQEVTYMFVQNVQLNGSIT